MAKKRQKSEQAKQLNRRLILQMVRDLVIYTIAFIAIAFVLNRTVVPQLADYVADRTSTWETYEYKDYPLSRVLSLLDMQMLDLYTDPTDEERVEIELRARELEALLKQYKETNTADATYMVDTEDKGDAITVGIIGEDDDIKVAETTENPESASTTVVGEIQTEELPEDESTLSDNASDNKETTIPTEILNMLGLPGVDYTLRSFSNENFPADTIILAMDRYGNITVQTFRDLQQVAIEASGYGAMNSGNVQFSLNDDGLAFRDLTTYNMIKSFKIPVAIVLFLIGFTIIAFYGFGRSLRYFDELTDAVGDMLVDREKPVKLSKPLAPTAQKLDAIRLGSLADERAAQAAERRKDELVAYLAHDIKTPLTSVMGYLMLLNEAPDMPEEQRKRYIDVAALKSERLESLIDEFFEITRYNLQAIPIERANIGVRLLCQQIADEFYPDAHARSITINVEAPESETFFVDPDKFARALGNIMRNAVAYADPDTTIELKAEKIKSAQAEHWEISVMNQGREISEAHLESIFEKFYREDSSRGTQTGRSGLGLAIAKEIVVSHGGNISATSKEGRTVFTIIIP